MSLGFFTLLHRLASVRNRRCHILRLVKRQQQQQHLLQQQQQLLQQQQRRRSSKRRDSSSTDSSDDIGLASLSTSTSTMTMTMTTPFVQKRRFVVTPSFVAAASLLVLILTCFAAKTWTKNQDWMTRASLFRSVGAATIRQSKNCRVLKRIRTWNLLFWRKPLSLQTLKIFCDLFYSACSC